MKNPIIALHQNLRFTTSGQVWADYLLSGVGYGLRPPEKKEQARELHQGLFRALPGESLMLGLCSTLDPYQVVQGMLEGVDIDNCPDWVAECEATLETVERFSPGRRIYWLSVPLEMGNKTWASFRAAKDSVESALGLPVSPPSKERIQSLLAQARRIVERIPAVFQPVPTTPAHAVWLHQHMLDRGLYRDGILPETTAQATPKRRSALVPVLMDEGGTTDATSRKDKLLANPLTRRFLKVVSSDLPYEHAASYQSMLVVSNVPDGEMLFPGGEMLGRIDESALAVDWAMRLTVRASKEVLRTNQRALETLNEQFSQREGELSHGVSALHMAAEDLSEYAAVLESDKNEVECQATIILSVAAPDPEVAQSYATGLATWFEGASYKLSQPIGYQEEMWWQMYPGVPTGPFTREYAQITTSGGLATLVPFASAHVGDQRGTLLAININTGPMLDEHTPCGAAPLIMHDPDGATDRNVAGSIAFCGDLGSGKSYVLKKEAGAVLDRGGRIIATDRTARGEWGAWAQALTDPCVVDVADPQWSCDPLRAFPDLTVGARVAHAFLTPLLNLQPTSEQGVLLSEVLEVKYLRDQEIGSLSSLIEHLASDCALDGAKDLARLMRAFSRKELCRVIFDVSLPSIDLGAPALVFLTYQLALPKKAELEHEHLFRQLGIEKIFGRAFFALITGIAKIACFSDLDQLAAFIVDEGHAVTSSTEGLETLIDFVRDGRKHRAVLFFGSHDPDQDLPSEVLRGLIPWRILMRHTDETLAKNGLRWLGLDPDDPELVELITKQTSPRPDQESLVPTHRRGECLIRDDAGRVARARILPPALKARDQAARTGGRADVAA